VVTQPGCSDLQARDEGESTMAGSDEPQVDVDYHISIKKPKGGLGGEQVQEWLDGIAKAINESDVLILATDSSDPRDTSWQDATLRTLGGCGGKGGEPGEGDDDTGDDDGDGDGDDG
jgi:hypothetical protein